MRIDCVLLRLCFLCLLVEDEMLDAVVLKVEQKR